MTTDRRTILAWFGTILILLLCLWPKSWMPAREETPRGAPHADKVIHFAMFAAFGLLWTRAGTPSAARAGWVIAAALALAVGTELAQGHRVIARDPDPLDALADALGGVMGVALAVGAAGGREGPPPTKESS